jgi:hypothetical protein
MVPCANDRLRNNVSERLKTRGKRDSVPLSFERNLKSGKASSTRKIENSMTALRSP